MSRCSMGIFISPQNSDARFCGKALTKHQDFDENDVWIEIKCNRQDPHEKFGIHWHAGGHFRIEWSVDSGGVWT